MKVKLRAASQLSEPVGDPVPGGKVLAVHWIVRFGGQVIDGTPVSIKTMVCRQVLLLPHPSEAVHVRLIVSSSGQEPAIVTSAKVIVGVPVQLSVAVAVPVLAGAVLALH